MKSARNRAIIPARKGSRRLPGKNLADLGGRPLLLWTVEAAMESGCFDEVVVSSDSEEIRDWITPLPAPVRFAARPPELAGDAPTAQQAVRELMRREDWLGQGVERLCMLLPTVPFRRGRQIREALDLLTPDRDTVISVRRYAFPPEMALRLDEAGNADAAFPDCPLRAGITQSQRLRPAWHPNGALYWTWAERFLAAGSFYAGRLGAYAMDGISSVDIDEAEDLEWARHCVEAGRVPAGGAA